uniref:TenA family protein n=1 Tax=Oscillatoriales cyanobacterium SpSt-402 TaxID=2282168 RepID=A0A832H4F2_9CYAN
MTISESLWQANQDLAIACLHHSFVQGIHDGSLPKPNFTYYVGQDAFFLTAFARAYSIAAAKSADLSGFEVFHSLASGVLEELRLHRRYAAEWGVDLQQIEPGTATRRYTDFLLATAWSQDIGMTAVAMAPCMRLYLFLGKELAKTGIPDHAYGDWIQTYSSEGFADLTLQLESLIERYATPIPTAYSSYRYAMLCERDFFQAAWEVGKEEKVQQ